MKALPYLIVYVFVFSFFQTSSVNGQVPDVDICLVTVDSASTHNIVVWEKPITAEIDSFFIYRMFSDSLYYEVGALDYDSLSLFHDFDPVADPNAEAHRYKLSTLDTAGVESSLSDYHQTMHLTATTEGDMFWSWYKIENTSNPVTSFNCYRDELGDGNFALLSVIPGNEQVWTDSSITLFPDVRYVIDVDWSVSCDASRENLNTSRSNLDERTAPPVPTGIEQHLLEQVLLYPNPSQGQVWLNIPSELETSSYVLWSNLGSVSYQTALPQNVSGENVSIELPSLASGIYYLEIETTFGSFTKKLVLR